MGISIEKYRFLIPIPTLTTLPLILKHLISLANREPQKGKDENRNHLYCRSISTRGGASRGQGEGRYN